MGANDFDIFNFLNGFKANQETKEQVTKLYIEGRISKDEFIRRMKNAKD